MDVIWERWGVLKKIPQRWWFKWALIGWAAIGFYDLLLSQIMPEWVANKFPKVHEMVVASSGWLPYWGWLLALAGIVIVALVETLVRQARPVARNEAKGEFSNWTNIQLRDQAKRVADEMRALEQQYSSAKLAIPRAKNNPNATEEEKTTKWRASIDQHHRLHAELETVFRSRFLAEARSLRDAILRKVPDIAEGKAAHDPFFRGASVLNDGSLAGPNPIMLAADYLESLSRTLP